MRQTLMEFLRCQGLTRKGKRCHYKARYGKFCGHHTSPGAVLVAKMLTKSKGRTLSEDLPGNY